MKWHPALRLEIEETFKQLVVKPSGWIQVGLFDGYSTDRVEYMQDRYAPKRRTGDPAQRCAECQQVMPGKRGRGSHRKFCSAECRHKFHNRKPPKPKRKIKCRRCKREVIAAPNKRYCSKSCKRKGPTNGEQED